MKDYANPDNDAEVPLFCKYHFKIGWTEILTKGFQFIKSGVQKWSDIKCNFKDDNEPESEVENVVSEEEANVKKPPSKSKSKKDEITKNNLSSTAPDKVLDKIMNAGNQSVQVKLI